MKRRLALLTMVGGGVLAYVRWIRSRQNALGSDRGRSRRIVALRRPRPESDVELDAGRDCRGDEEIWPWLVQIGWGRAGWYGYDWVDNGGKASAWEILPEHQRLELGAKFPMSPFAKS